MWFESQTPLLVASNLLLLIIIYYSLQPAFYYLEKTPRQRFYLGIVCIVLFCIFSFWGADWFSYQDEYLIIRESEWYRTKTNIEAFYVQLILLSPHYLIFRLLVWGSALLFVTFIIRQLKVSYDLSWFFFGVVFLPYFSYGRVSLAMAVMFYGAVLISDYMGKKKIFPIVAGGIFLVGSIFLHKSAALGVLVVFFSMLSRTTTKNSWFYLLVAFVVVIVVMKFMVEHFMGSTFEDGEGVAGKSLRAGQNYMNHGTGDSGAGILINIWLERGVYYLMAYLSYMIQSEYKVPNGIASILKIDFYLVLFSSVFLIDLGANTSAIYGRLIRFTLVPSSIVLAYAYQYDLFPKLTRIIFFIGLTGSLYRLTYFWYDRIVNS